MLQMKQVSKACYWRSERVLESLIQYFIDAGTVLVTKDNMDTYAADLETRTQEILDELTTTYLTK